MLMTPSLTSTFHPAYAGFGQDGIRHDLNRLYYNDYTRQAMVDPQFYGAPYLSAYNTVAPLSYSPNAYFPPSYQMPAYQPYDPRYGYARPYDLNRPSEYARSYEYARPYDFRSYEYARPYEFRSYEFARPYDFRPYDFSRSYETVRPQEAGFARSYDPSLPYARGVEPMARPIESLPAMGTEAFTVPSVNSAETPDAYLIVVELPGVDLKDVNLQIHGSSLVLNAFRRPTWSNGTVTVNYHFAEGRFGTLRRVLPLPAGVLPGQIQANFLNGLLTIVLPKVANGASSVPQASIVINSNVPTTM